MTDRTVETSPQLYARVGGLLYLIIIVAGIFAEVFVRSRLVVSGDAAATANNILASESLFRFGFFSELIMLACDVAVALIFYVLLKPVNKNLALLAAFFRLVMTAISGINSLNHYSALLILGGADYLTVFETDQLHALALLSLKSHTFGYHISLVFFGFHCLVLGYLIFRSGYLPKVLGILLIIASLGYLTNSFTAILSPEYAKMLFPGILIPAFIAEVSLCLWLIVMGVNVPKWDKQASVGWVRGT